MEKFLSSSLEGIVVSVSLNLKFKFSRLKYFVSWITDHKDDQDGGQEMDYN